MGVPLLLLLLAACADEEPKADPPELYDVDSAPAAIREAAKAVVRIQHPAGGSGTGSFISADGLLLTNSHVLGGEACAREGCAISISLQHQRGGLSLPPRRVFALPRQVDVGLDMAVLQLYRDESQEERLPTPNYLRFEAQRAEQLIGARVTAVGHPLGRLKKWSSGSVVRAEGEWFESTIFSLPGGSGSPILNDAGRIVGLLHRGSEGFDLLTRTSSHVSALASAAASLERAREAPLPPSVISLADPLTREALLAHSDAFLAASAWRANLAGEDVALVSVLGEACDEGLAREDYASLEELEASLSPCFRALDFIECRGDVGEEEQPAPKECPQAERELWFARMQTVSDKQRELNGSFDLYALSFAIEALATTQEEAERRARDNLRSAFEAAEPPLDFALASYLTAYGIDNVGEESTRELILDYARVPFYERYAWQIAVSALWLYGADLLPRAQALKIVKQLYRSDQISLGARLRIEELLFNADEL